MASRATAMSAAHELKILWSVISTITIAMMNRFMSSHRTTEKFFHDNPMLELVTTIGLPDLHVAILRNVTSTLPAR